MKKLIAFRGKAMETGKYVYAELGEVSAELRDDYLTFIVEDVYTVESETISQFVGYDKNGKMIFSDDKIRVYDHSRYCMAGTGIEIAGDFIKVNDIGKKFDNVELLEETLKNEVTD